MYICKQIIYIDTHQHGKNFGNLKLLVIDSSEPYLEYKYIDRIILFESKYVIDPNSLNENTLLNTELVLFLESIGYPIEMSIVDNSSATSSNQLIHIENNSEIYRLYPLCHIDNIGHQYYLYNKYKLYTDYTYGTPLSILMEETDSYNDYLFGTVQVDRSSYIGILEFKIRVYDNRFGKAHIYRYDNFVIATKEYIPSFINGYVHICFDSKMNVYIFNPKHTNNGIMEDSSISNHIDIIYDTWIYGPTDIVREDCLSDLISYLSTIDKHIPMYIEGSSKTNSKYIQCWYNWNTDISIIYSI